jgi:hypothetical protein
MHAPPKLDMEIRLAPYGVVPGSVHRADRIRRVELVNLLLRPTRMKLFDLGNNLSLQAPTGRVEIVEGLAHVWAAADRISPSPVDPLDIEQLSAIECLCDAGHAR